MFRWVCLCVCVCWWRKMLKMSRTISARSSGHNLRNKWLSRTARSRYGSNGVAERRVEEKWGWMKLFLSNFSVGGGVGGGGETRRQLRILTPYRAQDVIMMRWTICTHCHRGTLCSGIFQENLGLDPSPFHCHTAFSSAASFSRPCQRHTTTKKHSATGQKVCFLARKASIYNFIYVILIVSSLFASLRSHKTRVDPPATFAPLPRAIPLIRVSRCLIFYVCEGVCDSIMVLLFTSVAAGPSGPQIKCRDASPSSTAAEGSLLRGFVLGRRRKTGRACAERSKEPFHTAEPIMRFTRLNTNFIQGFWLKKK